MGCGKTPCCACLVVCPDALTVRLGGDADVGFFYKLMWSYCVCLLTLIFEEECCAPECSVLLFGAFRILSFLGF